MLQGALPPGRSRVHLRQHNDPEHTLIPALIAVAGLCWKIEENNEENNEQGREIGVPMTTCGNCWMPQASPRISLHYLRSKNLPLMKV